MVFVRSQKRNPFYFEASYFVGKITIKFKMTRKLLKILQFNF